MVSLYGLYQAHTAVAAPTRYASSTAAGLLRWTPESMHDLGGVRRLAALGSVVSGLTLTHTRPDFGIDSVEIDGDRHAVIEQVVRRTAFCSLVRFTRTGAVDRPALLLVAPLSGHFATMLTPTIRSLVQDHDVYVTDWHNARDVPLDEGRFGLDDYVGHVIDAIHHIGPGVHVMAVCQPCAPALVAASILAQDDDADQPATLTLMSGPIDVRANPMKINAMANRRSVDWYRNRCITTVPRRYAGSGRRVYPGFLQLGAFVTMNVKRHVKSQRDLYRHLVADEQAEAGTVQDFYREYFAVLDIAEEFYLENVERVFLEHELARGRMTYRGRPVDPSAITRTALLTIEAERDDMCGPGQTEAAHGLASAIRGDQRGHHLQSGVGHYGIFSGRRWRTEVYPVVRDFVREHG
jgi:poly(3-hydroxybutyrate) depolymerase